MFEEEGQRGFRCGEGGGRNIDWHLRFHSLYMCSFAQSWEGSMEFKVLPKATPSPLQTTDQNQSTEIKFLFKTPDN